MLSRLLLDLRDAGAGYYLHCGRRATEVLDVVGITLRVMQHNAVSQRIGLATAGYFMPVMRWLLPMAGRAVLFGSAFE